MADNYLEKKFEELYSKRQGNTRAGNSHPAHLSLNSLLLKNRSYRGFDPARVVTATELRTIVEVNRIIPSARNQQVLRFRMVTESEADKVLPHIKLGGALPELHLPFAGTEPRAFIIICSTMSENRWIDMDLGIASQSMLLQAVDMGLNGICIGAFNKEAITQAFKLPFEPLLILAIGKGAEHIQLTSIPAEDNHNYYRKEGMHLVPKVRLEDLILE